MLTKVNCPKCDGKGYIDGLSHYANGVCFCCNGAKTVTVDLQKQRANVSDYARKCAEWIMASTEESYAGFTWGQHQKARNFAYSGSNVAIAYPEMLAHYRQVGEPAFFAKQEEMFQGCA